MNSSFVRTTRLVADNGLYLPTPGTGGGGGGITQLTGDVLAGPALGSTPATVVRVNGATVPAAGALVTGSVLRVTGPSALGYGAVNLALAAAVTGLLAVANIAPGVNTQVLTTTGGVAVWAAPAGGSGITQLTGDVTAGPGSGSQAATVVRINGAAVPAAGALTVGNGLYVTGASALGYSALNLAGGAGFVTGLLPVGNIAPSGTNGFVLTTVGGATVWAAAGGGSGITQLTGDVTAGPGSGSVPATVIRVNGATVPAAGALTTGNVLQVTGVSALGYAPINLAGGANFVTGLLPVGNIAPAGTNGFVLTTTGGVTVWAAAGGGSGITQLTQDVLAGPGTGSQAATVVQAQAGVYTFGSGGTMTWAASATPLITQASVATAATTPFKISAQASSNAAGNGGILQLDTPAPTGAGTEGYIEFSRGGTFFGGVGAYQGSPSTDLLWLGIAAPTINNYAIAYGPSGISINAPVDGFNGLTLFQVGTVSYGAIGVFGLQIGTGTTQFGGGEGMLSILNAVVTPTTAPATSGILWQSPIGLHYDPPNATPANVFDFMIAPVLQGTPNTQFDATREYVGDATTTSSAPITIITIPVPTNHTVGLRVHAVARDVAAGTIGDGAIVSTILEFKNVAGTVTQGATVVTPAVAADTSLVTVSVVGAVAGTNALVQVTGPIGSAPVVDWTAIATAIVV